jgi:hypothetical protein
MTRFDSHWMNSWQDAVNADAAFNVIGRYFTADFLLGFGDQEYVVSVDGGRIERITDDVGVETPWSFALRAPEDSWEKFTQRIPPPMFNDIWAMAHPLHGRLRMDGDVKVLWAEPACADVDARPYARGPGSGAAGRACDPGMREDEAR